MFRFMIKIGWASLRRRRLRTLLVILMITTSLTGLLLIQGIYDGMTAQMIENAIRSDSGDISIYHRGYREDQSLEKRIPEPERITAILAEESSVKSFSTRILQDCLIATPHYSQNGVMIGIDLEMERIHGSLHEYLDAGDYSFGNRSRGAIIGSGLAEKLQVDIGNKVILSAQDSAGEISSLALRVTAILKTNNMVLDKRALLLELDTAGEMLQTGDDVSQISIRVHEQNMIQPLQTQLQARLDGLEIFRWDELYPALMQGKVMMEIFNFVTSTIIFGVAGFGIFGVMMVSVLERMREFGILLAIGTSFNQISLMVFTESLLLGLTGYLCGSLLGFIILTYFSLYGLDLSMFKEGIESFGMNTITYALIRPSYFLTSAAAVILATFLSVIIPLRVLRKAKPLEAIQRS